MKKMIALSALSLGLAAAVPSTPPTAGTHTITTTFDAKVLPLCTLGDTVTAAAGTSGDYTPRTKQASYNSITGAVVDYSVPLPGRDASSSLVLRCQKGTTVKLDIAGATSRTFKNEGGTSTLSYTLTSMLDKRNVEGIGGDLYRPKFTVTIPEGQWNALVGAYQDTVTMTVEWF